MFAEPGFSSGVQLLFQASSDCSQNLISCDCCRFDSFGSSGLHSSHHVWFSPQHRSFLPSDPEGSRLLSNFFYFWPINPLLGAQLIRSGPPKILLLLINSKSTERAWQGDHLGFTTYHLVVHFNNCIPFKYLAFQADSWPLMMGTLHC